jgi:hypothetical protein
MKLSEWELSYYQSYNDLLKTFRKARNCLGLDLELGFSKEMILRKCNHMVGLGLMAVTSRQEGQYKNAINYYISISDVYPMDVFLKERAETKIKLKNRSLLNPKKPVIKSKKKSKITILLQVEEHIPSLADARYIHNPDKHKSKYRDQQAEFRKDYKSPKTFVSGSSLSYV